MDPQNLAAAFQSIGRAGTFDVDVAALAPQMEMSRGMMESPMSGGRMVSGFYVPPSPLWNLGALAGKMLGAYGTGKTMKQQRGLIDTLRSGQEATAALSAKDRMREASIIQELLRRWQESQQRQAQTPEIPPLLQRPPEGY